MVNDTFAKMKWPQGPLPHKKTPTYTKKSGFNTMVKLKKFEKISISPGLALKAEYYFILFFVGESLSAQLKVADLLFYFL